MQYFPLTACQCEPESHRLGLGLVFHCLQVLDQLGCRLCFVVYIHTLCIWHDVHENVIYLHTAACD